MADQSPRLPVEFLQRLIKYYYFRRFTAEQAVEFLSGLVLSEDIIIAINNTFYQPLILDPPYVPLLFKGTNVAPLWNESISFDSDNSGTNTSNSSLDQNMLRIVRCLYRRYAEYEIESFGRIRLRQMFKIMTINWITPIRRLRRIRFPINCIEVTNGYRQMSMLFGNMSRPFQMRTPVIQIVYTCAHGGTFIQLGDKVYEYRNTKYQSLAAKDFFLLVSNRRMNFKELVFETEDQQRWPFTSFFGKIKRYFETLNHKIWVREFCMNFFENPDDPRTTEQGLIMTVLPFLDERNLEKITLRVMEKGPDVELNSVALQNCIQWLLCQKLDIEDEKIWVYGGIPVLNNLRRIHLNLEQVDLEALFQWQPFVIPPGIPKVFVFPKEENEEENRENFEKIWNVATQHFRRENEFTIRTTDETIVVTFRNPADWL